jgi:hypothetical protein
MKKRRRKKKTVLVNDASVNEEQNYVVHKGHLNRDEVAVEVWTFVLLILTLILIESGEIENA